LLFFVEAPNGETRKVNGEALAETTEEKFDAMASLFRAIS